MRNIKIGIVVADYDEYAPFLESVKKYDLIVCQKVVYAESMNRLKIISL